jgi:ADP-dependent NAD(P)H-hydrate dehydratase / NAD(P)H-hydrate epimerase
MAKGKLNKRVLTAAQAKALDKKAKDKFGIATLLLMENAGSAISEEALKTLQDRPQGKVAIFCGTGNNGGDGFCAARHLWTAGIKPDVYLAGGIGDVKNEARVNLDILLRLEQKITQVGVSNLSLIKAGISKYGLIIDALLGVGIKGKIRHVYQELINIINASKAYVLSVDIPSGLDATSGKVLGCCVEADKTVTFVAKKRGMVSNAGRKYCGEVLVKNIGIAL